MGDLVPAPLERVPTGIAGLDVVLNGGLFRGGSYLIVGMPGAGKTIMSNQICFYHVANGGQAIYVTLLTESHTRLLAHLRSLRFFDPTPISETLLYFNGYSAIEQGGLHALLDLLRREVRAHKTTLLVIDGLSTLDTVVADMTLRRFIHDLQASLDMLGCTTIIQMQPANDDRYAPVYTMVDGVIALSEQHAGVYTVRELEITKFRGSDYLRGRHQFAISAEGITVHPRTEALLADRQATGADSTRVQLGIARLNEMLGGGLLAGSTSIVLGPPGSGKTLLGLHLLTQGAHQGEPCLYFGFYETPDRLISKANQIGLDFGAQVNAGRIDVLWQPPLENLLDVLAERILATIRKRGIRRFCLDGLNSLYESAVYPERMSRFLAALVNELRALNVTTLATMASSDLLTSEVQLPRNGAAEIVDNIILLRYVERRSQLYRLISLVKVRESAYDPAIREFIISQSGIEVAATFESAEAILTDVNDPSARRRGQRRK